jgi:[ribosomal protein S5]-alanine N-acetyltransferase
MFDAELAGDHSTLAELLNVTKPIAEWPPINSDHDLDAVTFFRTTALANPDAAGWMAHYVVRDDQLVASAGFFGPPADGAVEIGYSVCQMYRRQGIATQAIRALIEQAETASVTMMQARVRPDNEPSIRALVSTGFAQTQSDDPDYLLFTRAT